MPKMATDESEQRLSRSIELRRYAATTVNKLQGPYLKGEPSARASLAKLRRADVPSSDGVLDVMTIAFEEPPEMLIGRGDKPSRAETALASALGLYATHQQSKMEPMHVSGMGLGNAVARLANPTDAASRERPVMRRFQSLNTATEMREIMHHLRGLVSQFRSEGIPLDYAALASDLYLLQQPQRRTGVRLKWAREMMRRPKSGAKDEGAKGESAPTE